MRVQTACQALGVATLLVFAPAAEGALLEARALLAGLGFAPEEIAKVEAGELVKGRTASSSPHEIVATFAFRVDAAPARLVDEIRANFFGEPSPMIGATGEIHGAGSLAEFAALTLAPDAARHAAAYIRGSSDLNLSADEIAAFAKLSDPGDVERQVRVALLARLQAYRMKGLAGIAPYARGKDERSPADDLRSASQASENLTAHVPVAQALLLGYPAGKPAGFEESFRWTTFEERGVRTIYLAHAFLVADGEARVAVEREFFVSAGYNAEQAVAAFLPTDSGTIVVYTNRTSTDEVEGSGGSLKRSIASRMLASKLERMLQTMQQKMRGMGSEGISTVSSSVIPAS
jgi:hypothetical protein